MQPHLLNTTVITILHLQFAIFFLLCINFHVFACASSQLRLAVSSPSDHRSTLQNNIFSSTFKLNLTSLDFGHQPNLTLLQGMQQGLRRSSFRLKHFQQVTAGRRAISFKTPVSTVPGGFLSTFSIGTPPVQFTAIVDTGSDLVWCQCLPCVHCYEQKSGVIFDPSKSSTYRRARCSNRLCADIALKASCDSIWDIDPSSYCSYSYGYGDQSTTSGDFSYDTLTLPDLVGHPHRITHFGFGCGHDNRGNENFSGAGGLVGFGRGPLSLPSQLNMSKFSYCLQSIHDAASLTSPLFMGAAANLQSASPSDTLAVQLSTSILSNPLAPSFYYVSLKGISVGGKRVSIPSTVFNIRRDGTGGVIFDSGTTITYLAAQAYDAVVDAFRASIPRRQVVLEESETGGLELCYKLRSSKHIPTLTFHFEGADLQLPISNYFFSVNEKLMCLAMASSGDQLSIMGNIQQQNFHILYDLESRLLSFTPTTCDTL